MKRGGGIDKLYDRLAPEERFRLVIEAEARGDEEESRRLARSAPRYTYTDADPDYINRLRASQEITTAVCLDLAPPLARVRMIEGFSAALPLAHNACINEAHFAYLDGCEASLKEGLGAAGKKGGFPRRRRRRRRSLGDTGGSGQDNRQDRDSLDEVPGPP